MKRLTQMTYGDYLQLETLLSSQKPLSKHHDEMCFILIHQIKELWMRLILHELQEARSSILHNSFAPAFKALARVSSIQRQMIHTWDVLTTLTPTDYMQFRSVLGQSSGFQSLQYRLLEFHLGAKNKEFLMMHDPGSDSYIELENGLRQPSLYDISIRKLAEFGLNIPQGCLDRDWSLPYVVHTNVEDAWKLVYEQTEKYWDLYQLAEKLVDIEDGMGQWRFRHMKTVERIIGLKQGTGGSPGVPYLKKVIDQRFFPELWEVRTRL